VINIGSLIESCNPARSLLMTYCASLSFFEQDVLPYLQQVGEGSVTVLLDDAHYEASFSDLVRGAGTRYRLHPVRLPNKSSNFHPKLYLFLDGRRIDLLVGSANLTPSGFRANAEIIDRLSLSPERRDDCAAISQYASMLRLLRSLDPCLPDQVFQQIEEIAGHLEQLVENEATPLSGPWFLHTIQETLLAQVARLIPQANIRHITAISPFFDEQSLAVLKLAETYEKAKIRLIKGAEHESLNGKALMKLGSRITVEEWGSLADEEQRRLHAKLLVFRSDSDEWIVSGSANLTRSAWLSTAVSSNTAGNVEAVVVRRSAPGYTAALLKSINTTKVDYRHLSRAASTLTYSDGLGFIIIDAELSGQQLKILIEPGDNEIHASRLHVFLEQSSKRIAVSTSLQQLGKRLRLTGSVQNQKLDYDRPLSVTVEIAIRGGQSIRIRHWVAIPSTLAFNSSQRHVRFAARDICRRVFLQDEAAGIIGDAITRFLTELGGLAPHQIEHGSQDGHTEPDKSSDRELLKRDFVVEDDALGALHASHARTAEALTGLAALLDRLLIAADEVNDVAAPADDIEEERQEEEESDDSEDERGRHEADYKKRVKRAVDNLEKLDAAFRGTVTEALQQKVSEEAVPFLLHLPSAAIAYVLLHAQIRRQLGLVAGHTVAYDIRKILRDTFSIDGIAVGGSYGWLIRAWASTQCRHRLEETIRTNDTVNELIAFVAAGLTFGGPLRETDAVALGILAGLHLVTGRIPGERIDDSLQERLAAVSQSSGGVLNLPELQTVVTGFSPVKLKVLPSFRDWMVLKKIDEATSGPIAGSKTVDELRRVAPELWAEYFSLRGRKAMPLAQASASENGIKCNSCQVTLPTATTRKLSAPLPEFAKCDYCHRILLPVNVHDDISEQLVCALESMTEVLDA
jgi:HKD family nuclease